MCLYFSKLETVGPAMRGRWQQLLTCFPNPTRNPLCTLSEGCLASGLPSWRWFILIVLSAYDVFVTTFHMCPPLFPLKVTVKSQPTVHCGFTEQRPTTLSSTGFSCSTRNPQCVDVEGERKATQWLRPGYLIALFKLLLLSCFVLSIDNYNCK